MTITGHEEEFRRLFEQEAGTRLSALAERAMELESGGGDRALIAEMFRDAHTLKGGAAVVGFAEVAAVVHELEQLLEELRSGARTADSALVDGVLVTVDAVREMVDRAMAGAKAEHASATALAAIEAARRGRPGPREPQRQEAVRRDPGGTAAPAGGGEPSRPRPNANEGHPGAGPKPSGPSFADGAESYAATGEPGDALGAARSGRGPEGTHAATRPHDEGAPEGPDVAQDADGVVAAATEDPEQSGATADGDGESAARDDAPASHDAEGRRPVADGQAGANTGDRREARAAGASPQEDVTVSSLPAVRTPQSPGPAAVPRGAGEAIPVPVARLDELVRLVGESAAALLRMGRLLADLLGEDPGMVDEYRELARVLRELQERTMRARMVSVGTVAAPLRRAVRDIARASGKRVRWELAGEDTELDRHVLEHLREPLVALVRNATDHGIEPPDERVARGKPEEAVVRVHAMQIGADVVIAVGDDGRGIDVERVRASAARPLSDAEALRAIFEPGLTTAEQVSGVSGRGVGLDAVHSAVDALRGRVEVRTEPGTGTEFRISVPMTLAVLRCLLVRCGARAYALPMHSTATALPAPDDAIVSAEGRPALLLDGDAIGFARLGDILGVAPEPVDGRRAAPAAVVLTTASGRYAFAVDELLGQRDVVVEDLGRLLPRLPLVAGASVEPDGGIMLVLDPDGLIAAARSAPRGTTALGPLAAQGGPPALAPAGSAAGGMTAGGRGTAARGSIASGSPPGGTRSATAPGVPAARPPSGRLLVVDDALTIRELQRSILERAGYEVATASDGEGALASLAERPADLVICDVEMPGMDGFTLTSTIRSTPELATTPVLILTSRGDDADRRRGMDAGADAYLVKSAFDEHTLVTAVRRLLGDGTDP